MAPGRHFSKKEPIDDFLVYVPPRKRNIISSNVCNSKAMGVFWLYQPGRCCLSTLLTWTVDEDDASTVVRQLPVRSVNSSSYGANDCSVYPWA